MKYILSILLAGFLSSCAHYTKGCSGNKCDMKKKSCYKSMKKCDNKKKLCCKGKNKKTNISVEYKKKCAFNIMNGYYHIQGKDKHVLKHDGKTYFFSSAQCLKDFKANIKKNISKANSKWNARYMR